MKESAASSEEKSHTGYPALRKEMQFTKTQIDCKEKRTILKLNTFVVQPCCSYDTLTVYLRYGYSYGSFMAQAWYNCATVVYVIHDKNMVHLR